MDLTTRVQILDKAVCISHSVNTLGKGMNTTIIPPARGKIVGKTGLSNLGIATNLREGELWIQTS